MLRGTSDSFTADAYDHVGLACSKQSDCGDAAQRDVTRKNSKGLGAPRSSTIWMPDLQ